MAEERFSLAIMAGLRPDSHAFTAQAAGGYSAIQLRLDRGRQALLQFVRAVDLVPIEEDTPPRTLIDQELLHEIRLSSDYPYEAVSMDSGVINAVVGGTASFTLILYGPQGTSVSVRVVYLAA